MWSDATAVVKTRASTAEAADAAEGATSDLSDATPVQRTPVLVKTRIPWLQQPSLSSKRVLGPRHRDVSPLQPETHRAPLRRSSSEPRSGSSTRPSDNSSHQEHPVPSRTSTTRRMKICKRHAFLTQEHAPPAKDLAHTSLRHPACLDRTSSEQHRNYQLEKRENAKMR